MPWCNADTFQLYLNHFSQQNKEEYKIIVLDNGAFHKAKQLIIPNNIVLLFLPAYSPELNPAEKVWQQFKRMFTNKHFNNLDQISDFFSNATEKLTKNRVISTCSFSYIFSNSFWSI